jgi:hypothetical protein
MQQLTLAKHERVFYLSDLLWFSEQIDYANSLSINELVNRIQLLLILFDRILLSPEHIIISANAEQARFKERFFAHPIISAEIHHQRIITSMWDACNDIQEHIEASQRYVSIAAKIQRASPSLVQLVRRLPNFKRNQQKQSIDAGKAAKELGWEYGSSTELLRYEDGKVVIPFSHESLLLGNGKEAFIAAPSLHAAKLAYFRVMSSGNGGVFRALVPKIETVNGFGATLNSDLVPPACFTPQSIKAILQALGINPIPDVATNSLVWRESIEKLVLTPELAALRSSVFRALNDLSRNTSVTTESGFKDALKSIKFVTLLDSMSEGEGLFKPFKFIQRLGHIRTKQITESFYPVLSKAIRQINELTAASLI